MAVWRRKPKASALIHSEQGSQLTSMDRVAFLNHHDLEHWVSWRGNCHDNAVAESFFNLLKRERIQRGTYRTREGARQDVFNYIEMFYNPKRKHVRNRILSPVDFERQQKCNPRAPAKLRAIQAFWRRGSLRELKELPVLHGLPDHRQLAHEILRAWLLLFAVQGWR